MTQANFLNSDVLQGMPAYDEMSGQIKVTKKTDVVIGNTATSKNEYYKATGRLTTVSEFESFSTEEDLQKGAYMIFTVQFSAATYDRMYASHLVDPTKAVIKIEANGELIPYTPEELTPKIYQDSSGDFTLSFVRRVQGVGTSNISDVVFNFYPDGVYEGSYAVHFDMSEIKVIEEDPNNVRKLTLRRVSGTHTFYTSWENKEDKKYKSVRVYMLNMAGEKVKEASTSILPIGPTNYKSEIKIEAGDLEEGFYKVIVKTVDENGYVQDYGRSTFYYLTKNENAIPPYHYKFI